MEKTKSTEYKWLTLLTVSIGTFMSALDASVVNISFPILADVFETDASVVLWVSVAYLLVTASLMLTLGRIADVLSRKKIYNLGFALFTVGLIFCSLSQSMFHLILSRIFQGVGAAMTVSLSMAIVTAVFPAQERGKALGILGGVVSVGLMTGPILGGFLMDIFGWRSIFYMRVPVGIIGLGMSWIILRDPKGPEVPLEFDLWGAVTLFGGLCSLLLVFNLGGRWGFTSPQTGMLAGSALILTVLFLLFEKRAQNPVVDLNLFRNRVFACGNLSIVTLYVPIMAFVFLMPFYLIDGLGLSASRAGLLMAFVPLTNAMVAPLSGWLSDKIGYRLLRTFGIALFGLALFRLSGLDIQSNTIDILIRLVVLGLGFGMFDTPNNSSIMGSVPPDRLGTASAMIGTSRQVGIVIGTAVAGTLFTSRQLFHAGQLQNDALSPEMMSQLSMVGGFRDTVLTATILCAVGLVLSIVAGKRKSNR